MSIASYCTGMVEEVHTEGGQCHWKEASVYLAGSLGKVYAQERFLLF